MKNKLIAAFLACTTIAVCNEQPSTYEIRDAFEFLSPDSFVRQKCLNSKDVICGPISYALLLQNQLGDLNRYFLENQKEIKAYSEKNGDINSKKNIELSQAAQEYDFLTKEIQNNEFRVAVSRNSSEIIQHFSSFKGTQEELNHQKNLLIQGLNNAYAGEFQK
jgi:hypothetical protein